MATENTSQSIQIYDQTLRANEIELKQDLQDLIPTLRPEWDVSKIQVEKMCGGMINLMFVVYVDGDEKKQDAMTIRIYGTQLSEIQSFDKEFLAMQIGYAAGCFPKVYASFANGIIYRFVPGRIATYHDFQDKVILKDVMQKLYDFQHVNIDNLPLVDRKGKETTFNKMVKTTEATISNLIQGIPEKATKFPDRAELFERYKRELPVDKILAEAAWLRGMLIPIK